MTTETEAASGYDWLSLDDGETVLWADTPHPYSIAPALLVGIPLSIFLVGLFVIAAAYLNYTNTNYVVTTAALYRKTGVLSRSVQRIEFDKVQDTAYQQGFLGAQFGYGTVNVSTAGGSGVEMSFQSVSQPQELQSLVNERIRNRDGTTAGGDEKAAVLDDILTELRAIRTTLGARGAGDASETAATDHDVDGSTPTAGDPASGTSDPQTGAGGPQSDPAGDSTDAR